jgi:hypothetical protein
MMKSVRSIVAIAAVGVGLVGAWCLGAAYASANQDTKAKELSAIMRKKLDASSQILEGLCIEDADMIVAGANSLGETMGKPELLAVFRDAEYREHNREFREITRRLSEAAKAKNFDQATLRWVDGVLACIECHDHTRNAKKEQ